MEFKALYKTTLILRPLSRLISNNLTPLFPQIDPFPVFAFKSSCFAKRNYQMTDEFNFNCLFSKVIPRLFPNYDPKYIAQCEPEYFWGMLIFCRSKITKHQWQSQFGEWFGHKGYIGCIAFKRLIQLDITKLNFIFSRTDIFLHRSKWCKKFFPYYLDGVAQMFKRALSVIITSYKDQKISWQRVNKFTHQYFQNFP